MLNLLFTKAKKSGFDISPKKTFSDFALKSSRAFNSKNYEFIADLAKGSFGVVKLAKMNIGTELEPSKLYILTYQ